MEICTTLLTTVVFYTAFGVLSVFFSNLEDLLWFFCFYGAIKISNSLFTADPEAVISSGHLYFFFRVQCYAAVKSVHFQYEPATRLIV